MKQVLVLYLCLAKIAKGSQSSMSTALITRSKSWTCSLCGCTNEVFLPYERQEEPVASTSKQIPVQEKNPMVPLAEELPNQQESPVSAKTVEPMEASQSESPVPSVPSSDHVPVDQSSSIPGQIDQMMLDPNPATTDPVPREASTTLRTFTADAGTAPAPSTGHIHFSVAGAFQAKVQFYERILMVVDTFSGAICALLVLWVLKHL